MDYFFDEGIKLIIASVFHILAFEDLLTGRIPLGEKINQNFNNLMKLARIPIFILKILTKILKKMGKWVLPYVKGAIMAREMNANFVK